MNPSQSLSQRTTTLGIKCLSSLRVVGAFAAVTLLGGCGHGTSTQQLTEAVRGAMSEGPSETSYLDLRSELKRVDVDCERFTALSRCQSKEFLEVRAWAETELNGMLLAGAEKGEGWAIKQAFYSISARPSAEVRKRVAERIILAANNDAAPANVQLQAGLIYKGGTYTQQNFAAAVQHLQKAWQSGEVRAAGALEELYLYGRDPANAYLWAVRCVSPCATRRELRGYLSELPPTQINQIQLAAREKDVLTVAAGEAAAP